MKSVLFAIRAIVTAHPVKGGEWGEDTNTIIAYRRHEALVEFLSKARTPTKTEVDVVSIVSENGSVDAIWKRSCRAAALVVRRQVNALRVECQDSGVSLSSALSKARNDLIEQGVRFRDKMALKLLRKHGFLKSPIKLPWGVEVLP